MTRPSLIAAIALIALVGCRSASRRSVPTEPALSAEGGAPVTIVEPTSPSRSTSFVNRHPLLARPKQVYDGTNNNKVVKTAAATVVGIPSGIIGELRQIAIGEPGALATRP